MYERQVLFFRVQQEGFSIEDYMMGFSILKDKKKTKKIDAIFLPKVGNPEIIDSIDPICKSQSLIVITTEKDLFDYLILK